MIFLLKSVMPVCNVRCGFCFERLAQSTHTSLSLPPLCDPSLILPSRHLLPLFRQIVSESWLRRWRRWQGCRGWGWKVVTHFLKFLPSANPASSWRKALVFCLILNLWLYHVWNRSANKNAYLCVNSVSVGRGWGGCDHVLLLLVVLEYWKKTKVNRIK